jgi:hypothetical protein
MLRQFKYLGMGESISEVLLLICESKGNSYVITTQMKLQGIFTKGNKLVSTGQISYVYFHEDRL